MKINLIVMPSIQLCESKKVESKSGASTTQTAISIFDNKLFGGNAYLTQEEIR